MVSKKLLPELILPTEVRIRDVRTYLANLKPSLELNVVPISDPFGPAITDETLEVWLTRFACHFRSMELSYFVMLQFKRFSVTYLPHNSLFQGVDCCWKFMRKLNIKYILEREG
jgi:hypothetical protein